MSAKKAGGLAAALRSKIGRWCWFTHPETGAVVQGTYKRGRKVAAVTGMTRLENVDTASGRGFNIEETIYTVPRSVKITFGQPPAKRDVAGEKIEPTTETERAALELYAETHGRTWKRRLLDDWTNGRTTGELQVIRNARGPSWLLQHFTLKAK